MTLTEIQKNIFNIAKGGGLSSDDSRLNSRLINFWIRYYRSALMPMYTDYGKDIPSDIIQDLGCLELTSVDKAECPDVADGCTVKKVIIPTLISLPKDRALQFIGLIDKQEPIEYVSSEAVYWHRFRRFISKEPRAYKIGNSIYVEAPSNYNLKYINIRGVFEDPTEVETKDMNGNSVCFDEGKDLYPIPEGMVSAIVQEILSKELLMSIKTGFDLVNDSLDNNATSKSA